VSSDDETRFLTVVMDLEQEIEQRDRTLAALRDVLVTREDELLVLAGRCANTRCALHLAHSGPCAEVRQP
jgi:hypothetical protein